MNTLVLACGCTFSCPFTCAEVFSKAFLNESCRKWEDDQEVAKRCYSILAHQTAKRSGELFGFGVSKTTEHSDEYSI